MAMEQLNNRVINESVLERVQRMLNKTVRREG